MSPSPIGAMRERITFQSVTETVDTAGGFTDTWAAVDTVWARVTPVKGNETETGAQVTAVQTYLVEIRHRTGLTTKMRILWGAKTLNIRRIENRDERTRRLMIEAVEGEADGQ